MASKNDDEYDRSVGDSGGEYEEEEDDMDNEQPSTGKIIK